MPAAQHSDSCERDGVLQRLLPLLLPLGCAGKALSIQ